MQRKTWSSFLSSLDEWAQNSNFITTTGSWLDLKGREYNPLDFTTPQWSPNEPHTTIQWFKFSFFSQPYPGKFYILYFSNLLVRATTIFSKAKTLKNILICHWPLEIIQFIHCEMHMDRLDKSKKIISIWIINHFCYYMSWLNSH